MPLQTESYTMGVEEEYQIVNPTTRALLPNSPRVLQNAQKSLGDTVQPELQLSQIEIATPVCHSLTEVREAVAASRRSIIDAAAAEGNLISAVATHPFSVWDERQITPKERYQSLLRDYQQLAREQMISGCHVHVGLEDRDMALSVMNRIRVWLTPLLVLAANSPFWMGAETGYASFRTQMWIRWPTAGPPFAFTSRDEYDALIQALIASGSIEDETKLYWDVRIPKNFPTIEFRVTDVCLTVDEAVMIAGLARALIRTSYEQSLRDEPFPNMHQELLNSAHWRAARYGLEGELVDIQGEGTIPAHQFIRQFLEYLGPALDANGDLDEVTALVNNTLEHGNGAMRQRAVYQQTGSLEAVVDYIVEETRKGVV